MSPAILRTLADRYRRHLAEAWALGATAEQALDYARGMTECDLWELKRERELQESMRRRLLSLARRRVGRPARDRREVRPTRRQSPRRRWMHVPARGADDPPPHRVVLVGGAA